MKVAITTLPFNTNFNPTPHLGLACLSAYLRQEKIHADIFDLRMKVDNYYGISDHDKYLREVLEIPDLPLLCLLIEKYRAGHMLNYLKEPDPKEPVFELYAVERGLSPRIVFRQIQYLNTFVYKYSPLLLKYDVIAFSLVASSMYSTVLMSFVLKQWRADIKIIVGGPQVTQSKWTCDFLIKYGIVDAIVRGEGEIAFLDLLRTMQKGQDINGQPGVLTKVNANPPDYSRGPAIADLNDLPSPNFDPFNLSDYAPFTLPVYSSRGCPFQCAFCSESDMFGNYRRRSPGRVVEDMKRFKSSYRTRFFIFADSLLNASDTWLEEFAERLIRIDLDIRWGGFFRTGITSTLASKLKHAGLDSVFVGVESFSDEVLDGMDKRTTDDDNINTINTFMSHGIHTRFNVITGFPGETSRMFLYTLRVVETLLDTYNKGDQSNVLAIVAHPFRMMPNSRMYENPCDFGIELKFGLDEEYRKITDHDIFAYSKQIPTEFNIDNLSLLGHKRRNSILRSLARETNRWGNYAPPTELILESLRSDDCIVLNDRIRASVALQALNGSDSMMEFDLPNDRSILALDQHKLKIVGCLQEKTSIAAVFSRFASRVCTEDESDKEIKLLLSCLIRNKILRLYPSN